MPDRLYRAQVVHPRSTGLPADVITNTFYFDGDEGAESWEAGAISIVSRLQAFFVVCGAYMSDLISQPSLVKLTDPRDPLPQLPKYTGEIIFPTSGASHLPAEVALCLSYKASSVSGENPKRRRGRVFLGPFTEGATGAVDQGDIRPTVAMATNIIAGALEMATGDAGSPRHAIYSPTTHVGATPIEDAFHDVEDYWIDNAFDTVRSRGASPTLRWTGNVVG
jgi:hypothetical protein